MDTVPESDVLDHVFRDTPRVNFLPGEIRQFADLDEPLRIGYGQTNSQPSLVRRMLEWLDAQTGDKVLDVGSGSGWTSALLSKIVGPNGKIYAVEKVPELVVFGEDNVRKLNIRNVTFYQARKEFGLAEHAPYDRILVSAGATSVPPELLDQLSPGGKMVIPVEHDIHVITRHDNGFLSTETHSGFVFVPLV